MHLFIYLFVCFYDVTTVETLTLQNPVTDSIDIWLIKKWKTFFFPFRSLKWHLEKDTHFNTNLAENIFLLKYLSLHLCFCESVLFTAVTLSWSKMWEVISSFSILHLIMSISCICHRSKHYPEFKCWTSYWHASWVMV